MSQNNAWLRVHKHTMAVILDEARIQTVLTSEVTITEDIRDPATHRRNVSSARVQHVLKKHSAIFFPLADKQSNSVFSRYSLDLKTRGFNTFG